MKYYLWLIMSLSCFWASAQNSNQITVYGSCGMCADRIEQLATSVDHVTSVRYDLESNTLYFKHTPELNLELLHQTLADAGHDTDMILSSDMAYNALPGCCSYRSEIEAQSEQKGNNLTIMDERPANPILFGNIYEQDGENKTPLIGANLQWLGAGVGATTDANGFFEIGRIKATSQLVISYVGFNSDTLDVSKIDQLDWTMSDGVTLDDVEVVYRKSSTSVSFINPIQITEMDERELCKAACCSLSESFETNPAVDASFTDAVTGSRQIQMLGLAGKYVQISTEIIPDVRSTAVIDGLDYIPGPWIQSIQLSKGAGSVAQGYESMTGQINVEIRKPETKERFYLNVYGNQGGRYEANIIGKHRLNKNWSTALLLHGKSQQTRNDRNEDGFLDVPLGQNVYIQNRWKYQNAEGWQGSFSAKFIQQDGLAGQVNYQPGFTEDDQVWGFQKEAQRWETWMKVGRYIDPVKESSIGFQLSAKKYYDDRSYGPNNYKVDEQNLFASALYEQNLGRPAHKVKVGLQYVMDDYEEKFLSFNPAFQEHVVGAFAEYTYMPNDKLTAVLGQRVDQHNLVGLMYVPRLHIRYAVTDDAVLRVAAGRGWRTARVFAENAGLLANNRSWEIQSTEDDLPYGLKPESNYNLGLNWTQNLKFNQRNAVLTLDYYYSIFDNQITPDIESANDGTIIIKNQSESTYAHSLQAQLDYELIPNLNTRVAYRYNVNQADFGGELKTIPFNSFHRAFINLEYNVKEEWYFDLTVQWSGEQRLPNTNWMRSENRLAEESDDYFIVMAQIRKFFNKNFEMYVGVENALDFRIDTPIISANQPFDSDFDASLVWGPIFGRNIYTGLRYRFD